MAMNEAKISGVQPIFPSLLLHSVGDSRLIKVFSKFVPCEVKSLNHTQYAHWRKYYDYKKRWEHSLAIFLGRNKVEPGTAKHHLDIISVRKKLLDTRNLQGGCKPIDDTLIALGWILDDNSDLLTTKEYQVKTKEAHNLGTWIILWRYKEGNGIS